MKKTPRGIRNNNPGNIRHGAKWLGMAPVQDDPDFVKFLIPEYGIRAMTVILVNYKKRSGIDTVQKVINRWAPPNENDTKAYVNSVASSLGKNPDQKIDLEDMNVLEPLILAIIQHENGVQPYSITQIRGGINMVVKEKKYG